MPLHLDAGRQRAPPYGHLGDLAVRVEQDVVHSVDHGVFDLQPEVRGVVRISAEDLLIGEVGRHRADGPSYQSWDQDGALTRTEWYIHGHAIGDQVVAWLTDNALPTDPALWAEEHKARFVARFGSH